MPGNILLLDPIATNRILMRVRLTAGYFSVTPCATAREAFDLLAQQSFSAVLCAAQLPDTPLAAFCKELTQHRLAPPVVVLHKAPGGRALLDALAAGAMDLIDTSESDALLFARLRALVRMELPAALPDGLEPAPADTDRGFREAAAGFQTALPENRSQAALLHLSPHLGVVWRADLRPHLATQLLPLEVLHQQAFLDTPPDVLILGCAPEDTPAMPPLVANLRAHSDLRDMQILALPGTDCPAEVAQLFDLGAEAVVPRAFDPQEIRHRVHHLVDRKHRIDAHHQHLDAALHAAVHDPLTGLHNRRFVHAALPKLTGQPHAVLLADIDHFKAVNDRYGHDAGDQALQQVAKRLQALGAPGDILARIGGEEFLIARACPTARIAEAWAKALCAGFAAYPITLSDGRQLPLTLSLGLVHVANPCVHSDLRKLLKRADEALYRAKALGRNQVRMSKSAA